jgi:hypothetical protein
MPLATVLMSPGVFAQRPSASMLTVTRGVAADTIARP